MKELDRVRDAPEPIPERRVHRRQHQRQRHQVRARAAVHPDAPAAPSAAQAPACCGHVRSRMPVNIRTKTPPTRTTNRSSFDSIESSPDSNSLHSGEPVIVHSSARYGSPQSPAPQWCAATWPHSDNPPPPASPAHNPPPSCPRPAPRSPTGARRITNGSSRSPSCRRSTSRTSRCSGSEASNWFIT